MILEIADIRVPDGQQKEFEEAVLRGLDTVLSKSAGYRSYEVRRSLESSDRYVLLIEWDSREAHTEGFQGSPAYQEWGAIVRPYFAVPPAVEHFTVVGTSQRLTSD